VALVTVVAPDLDGDSDRDGTVGTDDDDRKESSTNWPVYIALNGDDDDRTNGADNANVVVDGVEDLKDMVDLIARRVRPLNVPSGVVELAGADNVRIFLSDGASGWWCVKGAAGDGLAPTNLWPYLAHRGDLTLKAEGVQPGLSELSLTYTYTRSDSTTISYKDEIKVCVLKVDIAMDGNRDDSITFDTTNDNHYLFWVNDDVDTRWQNTGDDGNP
jgi:hypothetical protein